MTTDGREIVLPVGATAEPDTCGSCRFFNRVRDNEYAAMFGYCRIILPAKFAQRQDVRAVDPKQKDREYTGNEDQIRDVDRCDLHRPDGNVYIVQRRVPPLRPG